MSPDKVRRRSVEAAVATVAAWLAYSGMFALTFSLAGSPFWAAIRGGLINSIPDGVMALAARAWSRRSGLTGGSPFAPLRALLFVGCAAGGKFFLLWLEFVVHHMPFNVAPSLIAWQTFMSALIYVTVTAASHASMTEQRLREEEAHAARVDAMRVQAEMAALRAQLNPHFLFNTLHSVMGLVRRDPGLAEAALEKLGDLLHYAIRVHRDGVDWTALRHEWEFVQTYLDLERIRLGDRLEVVRRVEASALDQEVPTFSLQPLVENAVTHGIAPRAAGGRIAIAAHLDARTLRLEVTNDCPNGSAPCESHGGGLGLRVLRDRLEALYHGAARLSAGPTAADGYSAVLTLPVGNGDTEGRA